MAIRFKKSLPLALLGALLAGVCACSTATINFQSSPAKADIYVNPVGGAAPKLVGQTPLTMTAPELFRERGGAGPVIVEYRKDGYAPVRTVITDLAAMDLTINLELLATTGMEDQEKLNASMDSLFEGQRLARAGRFDDALVKLKALEKEIPQLAAAYELEGGIYYIQKKYKEALDAYGLAAKYNPKNASSVRMRSALEASLGVKRRPAEAGAGAAAGAVPPKKAGP